MHDELDALARCVADVETFQDQIWGRRAQIWRQRGPFSDLLSVESVEHLLGTAMRRPAFRLVRDGTTLPSSDVTRSIRLGGSVIEDAADLPSVIALAAGGATIVLQGLHHLWPPLQRFADELGEATSHRVQANAYLSPSGATGLRHHADTHEVLVLQVEGEKAWRVDGLGELTLRAGDVLYLPAGTGHSAASQQQHSLHITIGLLARSYRQVLQGLLDDQEELRRPLPLGFARPGRIDELSAELTRVLKESAERLAAEDPEPVAAREVQRARLRPRPRPPGTLRAVLDAQALGDETQSTPGERRIAPVDGRRRHAGAGGDRPPAPWAGGAASGARRRGGAEEVACRRPGRPRRRRRVRCWPGGCCARASSRSTATDPRRRIGSGLDPEHQGRVGEPTIGDSYGRIAQTRREAKGTRTSAGPPATAANPRPSSADVGSGGETHQVAARVRRID